MRTSRRYLTSTGQHGQVSADRSVRTDVKRFLFEHHRDLFQILDQLLRWMWLYVLHAFLYRRKLPKSFYFESSKYHLSWLLRFSFCLPVGPCNLCISGHMFSLGPGTRDSSFEQFAFQKSFEYFAYKLHVHYNLCTLTHFPKNQVLMTNAIFVAIMKSVESLGSERKEPTRYRLHLFQWPFTLTQDRPLWT